MKIRPRMKAARDNAIGVFFICAQIWLCAATLCAFMTSAHAFTGPQPQCQPASSADASNTSTPVTRAVSANDIPVAHTPPGGYRDQFPKPVLAACTEPIVKDAPDLRGLWRTFRAVRAEESSSRLFSSCGFSSGKRWASSGSGRPCQRVIPSTLTWSASSSAATELVTLGRIGGPCDTPPGTDWVR